MDTNKIDATHRILEEEFIRENDISKKMDDVYKKMMDEVNRRRDNKLLEEVVQNKI
jgi:hypothetical protein